MTVIPSDRMIVRERPAGALCGSSRTLAIGAAGGLTQFGAFVEILPPGSRSSIKHWHSAEDEMVYVLEGEITLIEGATENLLRPGDAATFRAGDPVGHVFENRGAAATRCLVVGTRAAVDTITYPDNDRILHRDRPRGTEHWTDGQGRPATNPYLEKGT